MHLFIHLKYANWVLGTRPLVRCWGGHKGIKLVDIC
jgi:hypothetical protein